MSKKKKLTYTKTNKYAKTHGMANTKIYTAWINMKARCNNKKHPQYKDYGGRGIRICYDWECSFECFYRDMGNVPKGKMLDRIDNNKGYYKENCRWVSRARQNNNQRYRKDAVVTLDLYLLVHEMEADGLNQRDIARLLKLDFRYINDILTGAKYSRYSLC